MKSGKSGDCSDPGCAPVAQLKENIIQAAAWAGFCNSERAGGTVMGKHESASFVLDRKKCL